MAGAAATDTVAVARAGKRVRVLVSTQRHSMIGINNSWNHSKLRIGRKESWALNLRAVVTSESSLADTSLVDALALS